VAHTPLRTFRFHQHDAAGVHSHCSVGWSRIAIAVPTLTDTITGFVNGDTAIGVSDIASLSTTAIAISPVGNYRTTAALGVLSAANYTIAFQSCKFTVAPAL